MICARISASGIVASPSPGCGPYAPKPAWLPPSITTKIVSAGSRCAASSIFSGVESPSSLPEMLSAARSELREIVRAVAAEQHEAVGALGELTCAHAAEGVPADEPVVDIRARGR